MTDYKDQIPSRLAEMQLSTQALQFECARRAIAHRATRINQLEHDLQKLRDKNRRTCAEANKCWNRMTLPERAAAERAACLSFLMCV